MPEYVPFTVLEKALAFAKAGGVVAGYGIRPCNTPTRGKTASDVAKIVEAIFAQPTAVFFEGEPDGAAVRAAFAKPHPDGGPLVRRHFDFTGLAPDDAAMLAVEHYEKDGDKIVVHAENTIPGFAGFIASIVWPEGNMATCLSLGGGNKTLKLDSEWTVERAGEAPVKPLVLTRYGGKPWGRLGKSGSVTASPYSESVATELAFTLPALGAGERVYFVCDGTEGEKSAAVEVNGTYAGGFIGAPFRLDITKSVRVGENRLVTRPFRLKNPRIVIKPL